MPKRTLQAQLSDLWSLSTPEAEAVRRQAQEASETLPEELPDGPDESMYSLDDNAAGIEAEGSLASRLAKIRQAKQAQAAAMAEAEAAAPVRVRAVSVGAMAEKPLSRWLPTRERGSPPPRPFMADPMPWTADAPALELAQGGGFFGLDRLHPAEQVHMLSLGGSGSGKTASNVAPVMRAMLRYALPTASGPKSTSLLIVDPKRELLDIVYAELRRAGQLERLHVLGDGDTPAVRFFDSDCALSCRDRLTRLNTLLGTAEQAEGQQAYWQNAALEMVLKFMSLEHEYQAVTDLPLVGYLPVAMKMQTETMPNFWSALIEVYRISMGGRNQLGKLANALQRCLCEPGLQGHPDAHVLDAFTSHEDQYMQWAYRTQCAEPMLGLLGDGSIANVVDLNPFPEPVHNRLDLRQLMDSGAVVVLQPEPRQASDVAARAIKSKWYECAMSRNDMERPIGVVCDEFQRFITLDPVSGDANFLDTARAYRVNCVFATQSVAALELALGSTLKAKAAVSAILCNTPSKWFFASKDQATVQELRDLIPPSPSGRHLVDVRPPAQLRPGEAYWSLANGHWGRGRADLARLR